MVMEVRTPNIFASFEAGRQAAQGERLRDSADQRQNMLADLNVRAQDFREMDANRDFDFRVEARDFQRQQAEAAAAARARSAAASERARLRQEELAQIGRVLDFAGTLPEAERFETLSRFIDPQELAPFLIGPQANPILSDRVLNEMRLGYGMDPVQAAAPQRRFEQVGDAIVELPTGPGGVPQEVYRNPGRGGQPTPRTTLAQLEADRRAGFLTQEQYDAEVARHAADTGGGRAIFGPDGSPILLEGAAATAPRFTEGQAKDNVYYSRAAGALPVIDQYEAALTSLPDRVLGADPTGIARGAFQSQDYQVARAAGLEFLLSILRKDTGAAVTVPEEQLYGSLYLPQPGDGPEVIAYKRTARKRALEAIAAGMSPAQMAAAERARQAVELNAAPQADDRPPAPRRPGAGGGGGPRILRVEPIR